jgi:lysozyme family protein
VVERHGNGWQAWRRAAERQIKCEQGANRRWTCTRVARPCRPGSGSDGSTPEPVYEPIDTVLRRGMSGEQVKTLQYLLNQAGYEVEIDGDFGRTTERALIRFQRKNRLAADGRAGPKTIEALTS